MKTKIQVPNDGTPRKSTLQLADNVDYFLPTTFKGEVTVKYCNDYFILRKKKKTLEVVELGETDCLCEHCLLSVLDLDTPFQQEKIAARKLFCMAVNAMRMFKDLKEFATEDQIETWEEIEDYIDSELYKESLRMELSENLN